MSYKKILSYIEFLNIPIYKDLNSKYRYTSILSDDLLQLLDFCNLSKGLRISIIRELTVVKKYGSVKVFEDYKTKKKLQTLIKHYGSLDTFYSNLILLIKNNMLERYGKDNAFAVDEVKHKIKLTNILKYGVENPQLNKDIKEKTINTNIQKYGLAVNIEKIKLTNILKYGCWVSLHEDIINKVKLTNRLKQEKFMSDNDCTLLKDIYPELGNNYKIFLSNLFDIPILKDYNIFYIPNDYISVLLDKINSYDFYNSVSRGLKELYMYILSIYNKEIKLNDRTVIYPKEIDIYLPDIGLGFEYNGLYWHSSFDKEDDYHLNKTILCYNNDIQLIHIFEDEWMYLNLKVKLFLSKILNSDISDISEYDIKINLSYDIYKQFIWDNTFDFDIIEYDYTVCILDSINILLFGGIKFIGGEYRLDIIENLLFNISIDLYNIMMDNMKLFKSDIYVYSYINRRLYNGNKLVDIGFNIDSYTEPDFYYITNGATRYRENTHDYRYKIYDCGNIKLKYYLV